MWETHVKTTGSGSLSRILRVGGVPMGGNVTPWREAGAVQR